VKNVELGEKQATIVAPFPRAPRAGVLSREFDSNDLRVTVDRAIALEATEQAIGAAGSADVRFGLYREISASPGGPPFAFVTCGRVRVFENGAGSMRVAAEYEAGELHGWISESKPGERDAACDSARDLPHGYLPVNGGSTALEFIESGAKTLFIPVRDDHGVVGCEAWSFEKRGHARRLVSVGVERSYSISGRLLALGSPVFDSGLAVGRVDHYLVADVAPYEVVVIDVRYHDPDAPVLGYRASAAERWFWSEGQCRTHAREVNPRRSPGRALSSTYD
jgi:hypothetical protein